MYDAAFGQLGPTVRRLSMRLETFSLFADLARGAHSASS
jgi:hypothetical protein